VGAITAALPTREEIAYQFKCVAFGQPQMGTDWSNPSNLRWLDAADALLARLRTAWEAKDQEISVKAQAYWEQCARDVDALRVDLYNLLAVIHRDGGHYRAKHGYHQAALDAEAVENALARPGVQAARKETR